MANPHDASPAMRDTIVGLAIDHLSSLVSSDAHRKQLQTQTRALLDEAAAELPTYVIR
jgi:hypothetical protein